ncbi:hypothetical protein GRI58_10660 [Porphyrobacter algicida]|uniref:Nuclear transport factor 2 family protein n=1 Tax=Qipengyuania algicida TaxID=1836209 RepID=A0A845AK57_9SPHN|nr:nuclear transport factor 2 family protein [Qipengyuania algicida]MXP29281.1 hypothetical protein [Qipengyuania algicida]
MRKSIYAVGAIVASLAMTGCQQSNDVQPKNSMTGEIASSEEKVPQTFNSVVENDELTKMFRWWNEAYTKPDGFTAEAFGQYFTDDAVMRINGHESARGLEDLASHFREIQKKTDMVKINLPFIASFTSPDGSKIYTYHTLDASADGKPSHEMVMGYAELRGGKIALINFLNMDGEPQESAR